MKFQGPTDTIRIVAKNTSDHTQELNGELIRPGQHALLLHITVPDGFELRNYTIGSDEVPDGLRFTVDVCQGPDTLPKLRGCDVESPVVINGPRTEDRHKGVG